MIDYSKYMLKPTPDEIDTLLARICATGYATEAVEIVEAWLEERTGYPGAWTAEERRVIAAQPGG